jgi:NAD(P)-dependent dehydrogenase (short-subunit alcohol dehydrogenase family)
MAILVTGGGRGIGRAIALAFAVPGATVAIAARTASQLDETARAIEQRGATPLVLVCDVTDEAAVARAFEEIKGTGGSTLDVVVNNAGVGGGLPIHETDTGSWRRILETNVWGTFLVSRHAVPLMRQGGRIINMSSVLGRFGVPGYTAYCASKHAVIGLTRAMALELVKRGVTVNAICPGWVETDMAALGMQAGATSMGMTVEEFRKQAMDAVPINRMIQPEEVANLVKFLASPGAAAITGQTYNICGGQVMS